MASIADPTPRFAILTAFGSDRPGMVASVADALFELGCNIEDTCMTRLRGEFTMMLLVRLPIGLALAHVHDRVNAHATQTGLTIFCRELPAEAAARRTREDEEPGYLLSVYGADHPGIVAKVATTLATHCATITDMNTRVIGPADRPVYIMILELQLAPDTDAAPLEQALNQLKPVLGVDLTFRPIETVRF